MATYTEQPAENVGVLWRRANMVAVSMEMGRDIGVTFYEEVASWTDDGLLKAPAGSLTKSIDDPTVEFDLLDPDTDVYVGSASYRDVRAILYSFYRHLALIRDNP